MHIIPIINSILTLFSLSWMFAFMIAANASGYGKGKPGEQRRENVEYYIQKGMVCQKCKEDIEDRLRYNPDSEYPYIPTMCKTCKRDDALDTVLSKSHINISNIYKNWRTKYLILCLTSIVFTIICMITRIQFIGTIGSSLLLSSQIFNFFYYISVSRTKKKS